MHSELCRMNVLVLPVVVLSMLLSSSRLGCSSAFSSPSSTTNAKSNQYPESSSSSSAIPTKSIAKPQTVGNILILDHLNINHEKGRHDWLKAFYIDFLRCAVDPRKQDNIERGTKTIWANVGSQQFHLPEGQPDAQVLQGVITLVYPDLGSLQERFLEDKCIQTELQGSRFDMKTVVPKGEKEDAAADAPFLLVTDPWGNLFRLVSGNVESDGDSRGRQPGEASEGLAMHDLTIYTPTPTSTTTNGNVFFGIARFYEQVLGAPILHCSLDRCVISVGPKQTLTFVPHPAEEGRSEMHHVDLRDEEEVSLLAAEEEGSPKKKYLSNYGPHISMYVADLPGSYRKAEALGVVYVNPRFKRRAHNLEQAIDDCMFRCLDIVDPENLDNDVILRLEHEVRSVVKRDGSKYKSCPFDAIPDSCKLY